MSLKIINHSFYNLLSSAISFDEIFRFSHKENKTYACIVEKETLFGAYEFYTRAKEQNLKPIIGLQINYESLEIVLLAKNYKGLLQLYKISSLRSKMQKFNLQGYISDCILIFMNGKNDELSKNAYKGFSNEELQLNEYYYFNDEGKELYKTLQAIKKQVSLDEIIIEQIQEKKSNDEVVEGIINEINIDIKIENKFNFIKFDNSKTKIHDLCIFKLEALKLNNDKVYLERLNHELSVIDKMGFNDYFLLINDYVN